MTTRDPASEAQVRAAQPDYSTWLAANAGSGKTRVLTDRVARLLLNEVPPQHILCLTYTKAAASEMQNRLFRRLGEWSMLSDDKLSDALATLGIEGTIDPARLRQARTLFARAIETPGGLKIQTIHSFCASLLRRFPLEAQVSPQFTEIEDRAAELLRAEIVDTMADGPDAELVKDVARNYTGEDFASLTRAIVQHRDNFSSDPQSGEVFALFDLPPGMSEKVVLETVFHGDEQGIIDTILPVMRVTGKTDPKLAARLSALVRLDESALPELESIFLYATGENAFRAKTGDTSRPVPSKAARRALSEIEPALDEFLRRIEAGRWARIGLKAAHRTLALHRFARRFIALYEEQKAVRGWLDFDDLIHRARALLNDDKVASWVLFRLDGGIDHILVDEAQDTSPAQWDVIRKLADEFTSGQGTRTDVRRTIFVVGDKKQSIYSFQGADPGEFDRMRAEFGQRIASVGNQLQEETLRYSFRSSPAVLRAVDHSFEGEQGAGFTADQEHLAFKTELPGRVDLWQVIPTQKDEEQERAWDDPIDRKSPQHHTVLLARQIADQIKTMIDSKQTIPVDTDTPNQFARRAVRPGDFLILVQRRSDLFEEIIRACKNAGLDIAGADRLKVGAERAVRDLAALLSFLAMPEDSLSLATALKSPLFGWSEQDLFDLAHRRTQKYLWEALRERSEEYPATMGILDDLRRNLDFLRPFDLLERILTRHNGRRHLLGRLGTEAEDGINALLSQALAYERNAIPSLTGFLVWMETDDLEIKRQIDSASDQIRVMTVHGAKGLEAPIVILPDTIRKRPSIKDDIVLVDDTPIWKPASNEMPLAVQATVDAMRNAQEEERLRLLYVALTRAEKWLIIAACGDLPDSGNSWYQRAQNALETAGATETQFQGLQITRLDHADWDTGPLAETPGPSEAKPQLDAFYTSVAPAVEVMPEILSPSNLGGAKALPGDTGRSESEAMAYGTLVHTMLEHLGAVEQEMRQDLAKNIQHAECSPEDHETARTEALNILNRAELQYLFDSNSLSEVQISAVLGGRPLEGIIDRLIITETEVVAIDFKTNCVVPSQAQNCPDGILRQMAAYLLALRQVYPERKISVGILWTHTAEVMMLPHDIVTRALQNTPYLDAGGAAS